MALRDPVDLIASWHAHEVAEGWHGNANLTGVLVRPDGSLNRGRLRRGKWWREPDETWAKISFFLPC